MILILGEGLHFDKTQAVKMATPFGGGVARWGTVCGAVVGGAMALGYCFGRGGRIAGPALSRHSVVRRRRKSGRWCAGSRLLS
ncbi:MAG: C-GCAxxG-C-C family protein [Proteobacteria bacterium]|nr:C-GCAxxG-C-C family protein [Pseudomonadota bacterium]